MVLKNTLKQLSFLRGKNSISLKKSKRLLVYKLTFKIEIAGDENCRRFFLFNSTQMTRMQRIYTDFRVIKINYILHFDF